jgi:hypothetical protein
MWSRCLIPSTLKSPCGYNPFHYIKSEKDILKLVNTIIANTRERAKNPLRISG